jgi:hypothetical protein
MASGRQRLPEGICRAVVEELKTFSWERFTTSKDGFACSTKLRRSN